ncbi:dienelactone hydrolase family protein [Methylophilus aquaticus]|uniref:Dienelactone hydrolase family protein n=1 Tax=Methylophilus aquaticus TaxID=1971610 RepID=A0ABT9JWG9_9PROT|nr:dienelactone hydrolase family protein [Methylophilus aquaticus]MDP8568920.1 dienelactone hydrolase family protein [Methylophilus aquaticus]
MIEISAQSPAFKGYLALPATGSGPGLVLCQEIFGVNANMQAMADLYAEEGYMVLVPDLYWRLQPGISLTDAAEDMPAALGYYQRFDEASGMQDVQAAITCVRNLPGCSGQVGVMGYCLGGKLAYLAASQTDADVAVGYYGVGIEQALPAMAELTCPLLLHIAELDAFCPPAAREAILAAAATQPLVKTQVYPGMDHAFARVGGAHYHAPSAQMAYSRTLSALRKAIGPDYDLSAIADHHFALEFATRDAEATMTTMVAEPYVNHVPTMTGGVGYAMLRRFYQHHFIHNNPQDMDMTPISRVVGADRMVDEFVLSFTHDCEIDWLLPNVAPTGRHIEIPMLVVVTFRGDKLYNEHIYWDQAGVLVQAGLLDPALVPAICGVEQARKLLDPALPSNTLMANWSRSANA